MNWRVALSHRIETFGLAVFEIAKHEEDATTHAGGDQGGEEAKAADPAEAAAADTPMPAASADDDTPADASPDGPTTTPPS